ncbi:VirB3 family type IV secretion system protein [Pantoea endophytica]|uniref:VirB3 family type IV secretion system protein n=1 Tax=Pantoea sp. BJ2 TaxID=3141322 RepID=A0AAU7U464_9GAMM
MAIVFKAMTRLPLLRGVPVTPAIITTFTLFMAGLVFSKFVWILIPLVFILMKRFTDKDEHFFSNLWLWIKTKGNGVINKFYGTNVISAQKYDGVDITEFINAMKLNQRMPIESKIPYSTHIDRNVIQNRQSDLVATWEVDGEPFECQTPEALDMLATQLNQAVVSFAGESVTFYVHKARRKFTDKLSLRSGNAFADDVADLYYAGIEKAPFYRTSIYVTLCFLPFTAEEKTERKAKGEAFRRKSQDEALLRMHELRGAVDAMLQHYHPTPLGMYEKNGHVYSSQVSFYNYLLSGNWQEVRVGNAPYYELMGSADIFISSDTGQINNFDNKRFFRSIEIKTFASDTEAGLLDALQYEPAEYVLTQSFTVMSKSESISAIKDKQKRLRNSGDDAESEQADLKVALELVTSGIITFGRYHYTLIVYADSMEQLLKDSNAIKSTLTDAGMIVTLSTLSLCSAFLSQMPGVYDLRPRLVPVSSQNFVELSSFHSITSGKRDQTPWGEAICIAKTDSHTPYYLNFHNTQLGKDDFNNKTLGNVKVIGTAGSGKTALLCFLTDMLQKYGNPESFSPEAKTKKQTTVFFDKDRGAEMHIRALDGEYFRVRAGEKSGWAPFKLEATKRNVMFIKNLMKIPVTRRGEVLTAREEKQLFKAVDDVMSLPVEKRSYGITRLLELLVEDNSKEVQENGLRVRLEPWKQGGEFGWVFDNEDDTFNIGHVDNFGIDGTEFLDDPDICSAISFYLLYRVTSLLDGRRLVIFMDEFWKWLQNDAFADFVYNKQKTIRKLNGLIVVATQSLDEVLKHKIAKALLEQMATGIYLANPKADSKDYVEGDKLAPELFDIIKGIDPESRQMLIVKNPIRKGDLTNFTSLVSFNLSSIGKYMRVLSGSEDNLEIFDSIYKPGMKSKEWLPEFIDKAL